MGEFPSLVWEVLVKYFQKTVDILNQRLYILVYKVNQQEVHSQ